MNLTFTKLILLLALVGVPVTAGTVLADSNHHEDGRGDHRGVYGVPGPVAGSGLTILALGYGAYWLIKRRRRKPD